MKARNKLTGEFLNVTDLFDDGTAQIGKHEYIKVSKLDFDFECSQEIYWEQRRYEIAKDYLVHNAMESANLSEATDFAIKAAGVLIEKLKTKT